MVRKYADLEKGCPLSYRGKGAYNHAQVVADFLKYALEEDGNSGLTTQDIVDIKQAIDLEKDWGTVDCLYAALINDIEKRPTVSRAFEAAGRKHGRELTMRELGGMTPPSMDDDVL